MRIDKVYIKKFKNLEEFKIDIDETQWENVFLGQNATGKSNFFEALVLIFKHLDIKLKERPPFAYDLFYICKGRKINVRTTDGKYEFNVFEAKKDGRWKSSHTITRSEFEKNKDGYLPNHVFIYYSGTSERMKDVYIEHQRNYYLDIIRDESKNKKIDSLRRIFLVQNIHSKFALLSFFLLGANREKVISFLKKELNIHDLSSVLLVLKKPIWSKTSSDAEMFWGSKGLVRNFLEQIWEYSFAPIFHKENVQVGYKSTETQDRLYLFVPNKETLIEFARKHYNTPIQFFNALESTHISDLIEDFRVRVEKKGADETIKFSEMSEGEQQLLTVLGMLRFIKDKESLILLDEPDTHLNPIWKWKYLDYFREYVGRDESTQILINTHDPLVIGGLIKEQIRIFRIDIIDGKSIVTTQQPEIDPRGLGVEGILTSELFGLPTTIDEPTQSKLDKRNDLLVKQQRRALTKAEQSQLKSLFRELEELGFPSTFRDPLYQKFIVAYRNKVKHETKAFYTPDELNNQNKIASEILAELSKEDK